MADNPNGAPAVPTPIVQIVITFDIARGQVNLQAPTDNWVMVFGMLSMAEKMLDGMRQQAQAQQAGQHGIVIARPRLT